MSNLDVRHILPSIQKTKRLLCVDGGWATCGVSAEVISLVTENIKPNILLDPPKRLTIPFAPAPSKSLRENVLY